MKRCRFIKHKGTKILFHDFSGLEEKDEALKVIAGARSLTAGKPEKSLLTITDVTGTIVRDPDVTKALYLLLRHNKPYVHAAALVGIDEQEQGDLYQLVTHQARRKFVTFDDVDDAKDWLAGLSGAE